ncbi:MAG: hypothetical protein HY700_03110 [Gemmatimonadetes bacterium]|nr:hypothetical protein [Gemmatimonadota bacterium]
MWIYAGIVLVNLALMLGIVRWRGFTSYEGLGMLLLAAVVVSDWLVLLIAIVLAPDSPEIAAMVQGRIWPGVVHLAGLTAFAAGLFVISPTPARVGRQLSPRDVRVVRDAGTALLAGGVAMKLLALWAQGITSIGDYFANLYAYTAAPKRFGTFLDWGTSLAFFGAALLAASYEGRKLRQIGFLGLSMAVAFFLTGSRAGVVGSIFSFFVVVAALNPRSFRTWLRPGFLALLAVTAIVTAGIKTQIRFASATSVLKTDVSTVTVVALSAFESRFGDAGVFSGYANMVSRQTADPSQLMRGKVLYYTLIAWVPHVVFPGKPAHPFRDIGVLIRNNFSSREDTIYAPMLVGYGFADFGLPSAVLYLFFGAFALGLLRRLGAGPDVSILLLIGYLHVTLIEGASNLIHNGFLTLVAGVVLAAGAMTLVILYVAARDLLRAIMARPATIPNPVNR